jgi:Flp pilus assembly protein TadB
MSKAPERIWAEPGMPGYLDEVSPTYTVGYIRADLHDALVKAADELAEAVDQERNMVCQDIGMQLKVSEVVYAALTYYKQAKEKTNAL